jgi:hypothetical protein
MVKGLRKKVNIIQQLKEANEWKFKELCIDNIYIQIKYFQ